MDFSDKIIFVQLFNFYYYLLLWDYNAAACLALWDTTEEVSYVVGYNGGDFPPLWDTTVEIFLCCGIQLRII
jgi:hypothetical protein